MCVHTNQESTGMHTSFNEVPDYWLDREVENSSFPLTDQGEIPWVLTERLVPI